MNVSISSRIAASLKLAVIGFLSLILLIPAFMASEVIKGRRSYRDEAVSEITGKWGGTQRIAGPVLTVPYNVKVVDGQGKTRTEVAYAHFLPETLEVEGTLDPEIRYRGIYEAVLYKAAVRVSGNFGATDLEKLGVPPANALWERSFLSVGVSDMRGIREPVRITWDGAGKIAEPGLPTSDVLTSGVFVPVAVDGKAPHVFDFNLALNGSKGLYLAPLGRSTDVALSSKWRTVSFQGDFLPEERQIGEEGFSARWKVLSLNRNYPQAWTGTGATPRNEYEYCGDEELRPVERSSFGLDLIQSVDAYRKTMRSAKYAFLFIVLTFAAFFLFEILGGRPIHPVQYLLIGVPLVVFYILLLSLAEHIPFGWSYLAAASATVGLISLYARWVLPKKILAAVIALVLAVLYGLLYAILQCEDYALLLGSFALFGGLALVMWFTRLVNWYEAGSSRQHNGE